MALVVVGFLIQGEEKGPEMRENYNLGNDLRLLSLGWKKKCRVILRYEVVDSLRICRIANVASEDWRRDSDGRKILSQTGR